MQNFVVLDNAEIHRGIDQAAMDRRLVAYHIVMVYPCVLGVSTRFT